MFDVVLREHGSELLALPADAALALAAAVKPLPLWVEVQPDGRVAVGATHHVGYFPLPLAGEVATVTVVPKGTPPGQSSEGVGRFVELVLMASGSSGHEYATPEGWSPDHPAALWPLVVARAYVEALDELVHREFRKGYRWRSEDLKGRVEGTLDLTGHLRRRRRGRAHQIPCTWEDFDWDHRVNRVLKAALGVVERRRALVLSAAGVGSHRLLPPAKGRVRRAFSQVGDLAVAKARAAAHRSPSRLPPAYRRCLALARLVLDSSSGAAAGLLPGVSFSAHQVFEKACESLVAEASVALGLRARTQTFGALPGVHNALTFVGEDAGNGMKPDLVLHDGHSVIAVGDAKYKELFEGSGAGHPGSPRDAVRRLVKMNNADLYQMFVYLRASGCRRGFFMVPFWNGEEMAPACVLDTSLAYAFSPLDDDEVELCAVGVDLLAPVGRIRRDVVLRLRQWLSDDE
jgi:hypothetical protein